MGSLFNSPNLAAYTSQINKKGLDLARCRIINEVGVRVANAATTIRPGQIVMPASTTSAEIIAGTGANCLGVSKWGKVQFGVSVVVDQPVTFTGTTAQQLTVGGVARGTVSNISVRSLAGMAGTQFVLTTDYTVNTTSGTVTRVAIGGITDGQVAFVTFTYALVDADFQFDGQNWFQSGIDDVSRRANRISIIQGQAMLFNMEYATNLQYTLTGAGSTLFCSAEGKFSNAVAGEHQGKVMQLPSASDPYMGIQYNGNMILI